MPEMDINNPDTWQKSVLNTPAGPIDYWVMPDWKEYVEVATEQNSATQILFAVPWSDAQDFKWYALGHTGDMCQAGLYLQRYTPLKCPELWAKNQYLVSLRKRKIHAGLDLHYDAQNEKAIYGKAAPCFPEFEELDGWPTFPATTGMPARIIYEALFQSLPWTVIDQDTFRDKSLKEQDRYVIRTTHMTVREQKLPNYGYVDEENPNGPPIPEVGFLPFHNFEFTWVWKMVPEHLVPWEAITDCALKINKEKFYYAYLDPVDGTSYRKKSFKKGDLKFMGLAADITPYDTAAGQRVVDLPYVFQWQTADGAGDGHQKIRVTPGGPWIKVIESHEPALTAPRYMHEYSDLNLLFTPFCGEAELIAGGPPGEPGEPPGEGGA